MTMPIIGERTVAQAPVWDTPRGMLREVRPRPDGSAVYVIEERPAYRPIVYRSSRHRVFMPWRYFFVKVPSRGVIRGAENLYVFFADERAETFDSPVLRHSYLPNIYNSGGICMGNSVSYASGSPLRSIIRFLREFYRMRGNYWLTYAIPKPFTGYSKACPSCPGSDSDVSPICAWSQQSPDNLKGIWFSCNYPSINAALDNLGFNYAQRTVWNDNTVDRRLQILGVQDASNR